MPTVKKEALYAAVGVALDDLFDNHKEGSEEVERTMSFVPNEDGSIVVTEPPNRAAVEEFAAAWDTFEEQQHLLMMEDAAKHSWKNHCFHCGRKPCIASTEYEAMAEIGEEMETDNKSNNEIRFALYAHMSHAYFGHLGQGVRKQLPVCIVGEIHDAYPTSAGVEYVGFKEGKKSADTSF